MGRDVFARRRHFLTWTCLRYIQLWEHNLYYLLKVLAKSSFILFSVAAGNISGITCCHEICRISERRRILYDVFLGVSNLFLSSSYLILSLDCFAWLISFMLALHAYQDSERPAESKSVLDILLGVLPYLSSSLHPSQPRLSNKRAKSVAAILQCKLT